MAERCLDCFGWTEDAKGNPCLAGDTIAIFLFREHKPGRSLGLGPGPVLLLLLFALRSAVAASS